MAQVGIVTSSTACIPPELVAEYDLIVVPLSLVVGERIYRDGADISRKEFYELMARGEDKLSTSAPSMGEYLETFRQLADRYDSILCITMAGDVSTTYAAAKNSAAKLNDVHVEVLDSRTAATAEGQVVLEAARAVREGLELEEILMRAHRVASEVKLFGAIETLEYLKRSGRVRSIKAMAANALKLKPVIGFFQGDAHMAAKTISKRRSLEWIARAAVDVYKSKGRLHLAVFHVLALDQAQALKERIEAEAECEESFVTEFTPVMGTHTGPGLVGASFW